MTNERRPAAADTRIQSAIAELQRCLQTRFPDATFVVTEGEDPEGTYLVVTVDVEDTDEVVEVVRDQLFRMQVEEALPLYLVPALPLARVAEQLRGRAELGASALPPVLPL